MNAHRGPMDYEKWIAKAAGEISRYLMSKHGGAISTGDICEIIERNAEAYAHASELLAACHAVVDWFAVWSAEIGPAEESLLDRLKALIAEVEGGGLMTPASREQGEWY
jgi:hypothetical protein